MADMLDRNWLDIFTANHGHRQALLLNAKDGSFEPMPAQFGLNHDPRLPGTEQSTQEPQIRGRGLWIFWRD